MAGTFEGLTDLKWQFFADLFPPQPTKRGRGMPLVTRTTPANGDERANVIPLLDILRLRIGKPGRPRKRLKVLAEGKGYDAKDLRRRSASAVSAPRFPNGSGSAANLRGGRSNRMSHATKLSARLPDSSTTTAWSSVGNIWPPASTRCWRLLWFICGSIN